MSLNVEQQDLQTIIQLMRGLMAMLAGLAFLLTYAVLYLGQILYFTKYPLHDHERDYACFRKGEMKPVKFKTQKSAGNE